MGDLPHRSATGKRRKGATYQSPSPTQCSFVSAPTTSKRRRRACQANHAGSYYPPRRPSCNSSRWICPFPSSSPSSPFARPCSPCWEPYSSSSLPPHQGIRMEDCRLRLPLQPRRRRRHQQQQRNGIIMCNTRLNMHRWK